MVVNSILRREISKDFFFFELCLRLLAQLKKVLCPHKINK